jgi:hypothetical protein
VRIERLFCIELARAKMQGLEMGSRLVCSGQMRLLRGVLVALLAGTWAGVASCSFPDFVVVPDESALCDDLLLNGAETDTDCGGADCDACSQGRSCAADRDCMSKRCVDEVCRAPSCDDGVANGTETGRDCGGNCAEQKCEAGEGCVGGTDCESQVCTKRKCQAPTCEDSTRNGGESDRDCGGGTCEACSDGLHCNVNTDCAGKLCDRETCVPVHCTDDVSNENETDVDCGGPCAKCGPGQVCELDGDCDSNVCTRGICAAPACDDEVNNGEETDLDCGGPDCSRCEDSLACLTGSDCVNGVCQGGRCQPATCADSVKNGEEADTDCGSACPLRCPDGQECLIAPDCMSGVCAETCQKPTCDDSVVNGSEPDVDCGADCGVPCRTGQACHGNDDCVTGACVEDECTATLQVFYKTEPANKSQFIRPFLEIRNTGPTAVPAAELELRYFYTNDGFQNEVPDCYFAEFDCKRLVVSIAAAKPATPLADHYLSVKFGTGSGSVPANGTYGLQPVAHDFNYAYYDQAGDYSYDPSKKEFAAHEGICLYRKGTLIWGTEPAP